MAAQSQPVSADASTITYPRVAKALIARVKWFDIEQSPIKNFALASRRAQGVPDLTTVKHREQLKRIRGYLDLLEFDTTMSPELHRQTSIEAALNLINGDGFYFPVDVKQRAARLLEFFQAENWGATAANATSGSDDDDDGEEEEEEVASPSTAAAPAAHVGEPASATVTIRLPPPNHPIWGDNGIMRGIGKLAYTFRLVIFARSWQGANIYNSFDTERQEET